MKISSMFLFSLLLMLTSCLITKNNPKELTDLFPLTSRNPKSIVFRSKIDNGPMLISDFEYYIFFPEEHIFLYHSTIQMLMPRLGYYEFRYINNEIQISLQEATDELKDIKMGLKTNQGSKDSLYFHIQIEKMATISPLRKYILSPIILIYTDNIKYVYLDRQKIYTNHFINTPDKEEFIVSTPRSKGIKKIGLDMGIFIQNIDFDIESEYNYYYATGSICDIHSDFLFLTASDMEYTAKISKIVKNTYNFEMENDDAQYKRLRLKALNKSERAYIYALPQYIKALECAGTYPQK